MAVSETRDLNVPGGFALLGSERTVFELSVDVLVAGCSLFGVLLASERIEFLFELSLPLAERTVFDCK